ncbi:hypothetical protein CERZMDRAFT_39133 [Cercospora zeae-maydis SCOH1-5]|uniref:Uncharacterized protein n=1 Tax=Cercospora zeae-maydis SCOH1-5 TaxID=717836 RepID=A0A6A6FJE4_9PEZI|nr:hypothetical protein CERZMDRAFT_39133 [Cercospora zeae-maydis SCOH1-5]
MGLFDKIRAKMELRRLEQRYTKRERRTTFYANAQYVDGEYVYNQNTGSSSTSAHSFGNDFVPANGKGNRTTRHFA